MKLKKYIGDKAFYKRVLAIALPMIIQNMVTNLVNLLDNLMVGSLGTEQMSGVAIVNQFIFVFNLAVFGAVSGAGIFTAQFNGRGDVKGVRDTMRIKLILSAAIGVGYVIVAGTGFTAQIVVCIIALVFMGWLCAMVGYDKVVGQFKNINKGE